MTRVLVVEDSRIVRRSICSQLEATHRYTVVGAIENAANAELVCIGREVHLILMDICTADEESGLNAAERIKKSFPSIRIVLMTAMPEYSFLRKAQQAGADGFWYKEYGDTDLIELLDRIMAGETVWPEETPLIAVGETDNRHFSAREMDILRQMALGNRYEDIAQSLQISVNTVKYHVKTLLQKTGCRNTMQLVTELVEKQLILTRY